MKISKETLALLKNFATINSNLLIKPGSTLNTISVAKSVYASTEVKETFEQQFGIYDLNEFLGALALFDDPDVTFGEKYATISQGRSSVRYFGADESVLTAPNRAIKIPPADIEFELSADQINMINKTAGVLRASDVTIAANGTDLRIIVGDKKNPTGNNYEMVLDESDETFRAHIRVDNMKMLPGNYTVQLAAKKIASFTNGDLQYVLTLEQDSVFED